MENQIEILWLIIAGTGSFMVGILSFVIRRTIDKNATKDSVTAITNLQQKDIAELQRKVNKCDNEVKVLHSRISDCKGDFVSKEMFTNAINQFDKKLDLAIKVMQNGVA